MKTLYTPIAYFILSILLIGCAAKPKLSNAFKGNYTYSDTPITNAVQVSVSMIPLPSPVGKPKVAPKTFFSLSDSVQKTFLRELARLKPKPAEFISLIKEDLSNVTSKPGSEPYFTDYNEYRIRFSFSNIKSYTQFRDTNGTDLMHPNTRLTFLNTTLNLQENSGYFINSIDRLENELERIDLGTLDRTNDVSFNSKLAAELGVSKGTEFSSGSGNTGSQNNNEGTVENVYDEDGNLLGSITNGMTNTTGSQSTNSNKRTSSLGKGVKGEISYLASESIKESRKLNLERLKMGFSFGPKFITLSQYGAPLSEITHNVYVVASLKFENSEKITRVKEHHAYKVSNLYDTKTYEPLASKDINIRKRMVVYATCNAAKDLSFKYSYNGAIRAVKNNEGASGNNQLEFDDHVVYYAINDGAKHENQIKTLKVDKYTFCHNAYTITGTKEVLSFKLYIDTPQGSSKQLILFDTDHPEYFMGWLQDQLAKPDKKMLSTKKFKMHFKVFDANHNQIKTVPVVKSIMTDEDIKGLKDFLKGAEFKLNDYNE